MSKEEQLGALIRNLRSLDVFGPLLPEPLERDFQNDAKSFRTRRLALESSICLALYLPYAFSSQIISSASHSLEAVLRFGVLLPLLLLINCAQWFRPSSTTFVESLIIISTFIAASFEVLVQLRLSANGGYAAQAFIIAVLISINTLIRPQFSWALIVLGWASIVEAVCISLESATSLNTRLFQAAVILGIGLLTVIANYSQNREARLAFLRVMQKREILGNMAQHNQELAAAAFTDALTGVANRACLDNRLAELWSENHEKADVCSIIMVDIDHFKDINDRYGHLYGDRVLKRVALLLSEALRGQNDFVARYGGEEFAVVLPDTPPHLAMHVAERLRGLIELAGLPSLRTGDLDLGEIRATVSCGVAAGGPRLLVTPEDVLQAADEALYLAKGDGRNAVRGESFHSQVQPFPTSESGLEIDTFHHRNPQRR